MGGTISGRRLSASDVGRIVLGALLAGGIGAVALTAAVGFAAALVLLHIVALTGAAVAGFQALRARRAAEKASAELEAVSDRIVQLELRLAQQRTGAESALHSTVVEVTGEIGLLGRSAPEPVEPLVPQDRGGAGPTERLAPATPSPRPVAPRGPDEGPAPSIAPDVRHPEPSLLPTARKEQAGRPDAAPSPGRVRARPAASMLARGVAEPHRPSSALERPAAALSDAEAQRMAAIVEAFEADRIELYLQPVVSLPRRGVRWYEALARLRLADETLLLPAEFLPLLERLGHAGEFDRRILGRTIAVARFLMARSSDAVVGLNLAPRALEDAGFLRSLRPILEAAPDTIGRIVFELSQRCWRTLDPDRAAVLAAFRDKGVPFALDSATDLRLDPLALAGRGVRFAKIPADLLLSPDQDRDLEIPVRELPAVLLRAGIEVVAERVEREETVPDLIGRQVPLAQGFVFAAPRAVRSEVLSLPQARETARRNAVEAPLGPGPEAPATGGGVLPYRTSLRRRS
jgi:cyclic-di-GMP phosphodiesterase, flagellum assembly factor TipF